MNNEQFNLLKFKVGDKLLQYILNFNSALTAENIADYNFDNYQIETLKIFDKIIVKCEILANQRQYSTIKEYLYQKGNTFNQLRENCGGKIQKNSAKEELLSYLLSKTIEFYPCLLITTRPLFFKIITFESYFPRSLEEGNYISNLIKNHPHLNKLLDVNENSYMNRFSFILSNNNISTSFLYNFVEHFIVRSFLNCCYRSHYRIEDVLKEVENQFDDLIKIAKGEKIQASFFCGISGLRLSGIDEYKLKDNIILRNINEINNPGIHDTISTTTINDEHKVIGCTLEYKIELESLGKILEKNNLFETGNHFIDLFTNLFKHSIILSQNSIYPPINVTFIDMSYPLHNKFPQFNSEVKGFTILEKNQLDEVSVWFCLLNNINLEYVNLTMERIKSAIYNNHNPIASILDAFISWESMFSSKISTTNSVVKSIAIMLERNGYKISKNKLQNLYDLRSDIVHGNPTQNKIVKGNNLNNNLGAIQRETIEIALNVFKALLSDTTLLNKTPNERVVNLLKPEIIECEKCGNKKYKFN